jgi:hypothetical protein
VDVHLEDIKEEDELEQTGKDDSVEESVVARVESVNEQEHKIEQMGEAEFVQETVLARVECVNVQHLNVQVEDNQSGLSDSPPPPPPPPRSSMEMTVKLTHIK